MEIGKATEIDIPQLVTLVNSAYRGESSRNGWTTEADLLEGTRTDEITLLQEMQEPGTTILKVTENNSLLACVYLQFQQTELYLGMLTVSPAIQNRGMGKLLLAKAEEIGREHQCTAITMTVISERRELIGWYQRHGFEPTGERKPFLAGIHIGIPKHPLEFVVLKKQL